MHCWVYVYNSQYPFLFFIFDMKSTKLCILQCLCKHVEGGGPSVGPHEHNPPIGECNDNKSDSRFPRMCKVVERGEKST